MHLRLYFIYLGSTYTQISKLLHTSICSAAMKTMRRENLVLLICISFSQVQKDEDIQINIFAGISFIIILYSIYLYPMYRAACSPGNYTKHFQVYPQHVEFESQFLTIIIELNLCARITNSSKIVNNLITKLPKLLILVHRCTYDYILI